MEDEGGGWRIGIEDGGRRWRIGRRGDGGGGMGTKAEDEDGG